MVKEITKIQYQCPYCNTKYDSESDAESCRDDCVDPEPVEEITDEKYLCEYCHKEFDDEDDANDCEKIHKKNKDACYDAYNLEKLTEIGNQKSQTKLGTFIY